MSFTAIFIALLLERFFDFSHLRQLGWFGLFQRLVSQKLPGQSPYVILAATILPLVLAVVIIQLALDDAIFGFLNLGFSTLVILYCLGPRNLWADIFDTTTSLSSGDAASAKTKLMTDFGISNVTNEQDTHRELVNKFFVAANKRVFAIFFWYGCLGLFGVVLYRFLSAYICVNKEAEATPVVAAAKQGKAFLDWPAIRTLTFVFALGGNFSRVFGIWCKKIATGVEENEPLLLECGNAALNNVDKEKIATDGSAEREAVALLDRSMIMSLVVVAVMVFLI